MKDNAGSKYHSKYPRANTTRSFKTALQEVCFLPLGFHLSDSQLRLMNPCLASVRACVGDNSKHAARLKSIITCHIFIHQIPLFCRQLWRAEWMCL